MAWRMIATPCLPGPLSRSGPQIGLPGKPMSLPQLLGYGVWLNVFLRTFV